MNQPPAGDFSSGLLCGLIAGAVLIVFIVLNLWLIFRFFSPWMRAFSGGAPVSIFSIIGMRLRGTPANMLIDAYVTLKQRGVTITFQDLERTYLAQRNEIQDGEDLLRKVEKEFPKQAN